VEMTSRRVAHLSGTKPTRSELLKRRPQDFFASVVTNRDRRFSAESVGSVWETFRGRPPAVEIPLQERSLLLLQFWMYSKSGEIRRDEACLDYSGQEVILYPCHGSKGNQFWDYNKTTKLLRHGSSDKCLAINEAKNKLLMEQCDGDSARQQWSLENYDANKL
jgi:hypothetical protein